MAKGLRVLTPSMNYKVDREQSEDTKELTIYEEVLGPLK